MLEKSLGGRAVHVAEVEQALADGGVHLAVANVAEGGRFGVGDPEGAAVGGHREAGRLRHPDLVERAVAEGLDRGAGVDAGRAPDGVEPPQLVDAGHGDDDLVVVPGQIPRRGQVDGEGVVWHQIYGGAPLVAGAGDGRDLVRAEVDAAEEVVDRIGDDQVVAGDFGNVVGQPAESARLGERGGATQAVGSSALAGAEAPEDGLTVIGELDNTVVGRVAHEDGAVRPGDGLAGEAQGRDA